MFSLKGGSSVLEFMTAQQLAEALHGEISGDGSVNLTGLAPAVSAQEGDLTFADNDRHFEAARQSGASAILTDKPHGLEEKVLIRVVNARVSMAQALRLFFPPEEYAPGIHASARVDATAQVDSTAHIGPHCSVGPGSRVGAGSVLVGGNHLGRNAWLGEGVRLHPNVVVYARSRIGNRVTIHAGTVIGADGYGYVFDAGRHEKVLQVGDVIIGDDVEIGANSAVDRGALGSTVVGAGTKIDNLVHIAHNVVIGRHCLVMGQCGFAGSTQVGDYAVVASQAGISGHLVIGRQAVIGAKSGVMRDVADGERVLGIPAATDRQAKRQMIGVTQLPELIRRVRALESAAKEAANATQGRSAKSTTGEGEAE
jgi:UDP-3-O-[3-hydroxymyristoyl] glucosamine N-acyltransferase